MMRFAIRSFMPADQQGVMNLILAIQREEYRIAITAEDQPDLHAIPQWYQAGAGAFLVAEHAGRIVGTIALKDIGTADGGARMAALRKMFVRSEYRGASFGLAQALLARLLEHACAMGVRHVYLGTNERFRAAHRFYEKNGFRRSDPADLPHSFPRMAVDTHFYALDLN